MTPVTTATLVSMYVRPEHRSVGLGSRLVTGFAAWAREAGAGAAEATAYSADAIRFYERNGFTPQSVTLRTGW